MVEDGTKQGHPRGLYTLFFTEMWERFSYYGMRALLVLFMVDLVQKGGLGFEDKTATAIYGLYTAFVYMACLPGGWVSDRLLGAQRSVWYGGIVIAMGHFVLAIPATKTFFLGLILVVVGTGMLKPNVSAMVGQLYPDGGAGRDAGFTIFYLGINLGAAIGPLVCSFLGENYNWHYGFGAAGVGMVLGLIQYRLTARHLGAVGQAPEHSRRSDGGIDRAWYLFGGGLAALVVVVAAGLSGMLKINPVVLARNTTYIIVGLAVVYFAGIFVAGKLDRVERNRVIVIIVLFFASAMFWAGFEQAGSSLNLFAERHTVRTLSSEEGDPTFVPEHLVDVPAWSGRLQATNNPVSVYLMSRFSEGIRSGISGVDPVKPKKGDGPTREAMVGELNGVVEGVSIYESNRFAKISLPVEVQTLLEREVAGADLARLNRLLLEAAYPKDIEHYRFEIPAGWFQSLNPAFIIIFAPMFATMWVWLARRNLNPTMPVKFAFGLILLAVGFLVMFGAARLVIGALQAGLPLAGQLDQHRVLPTWLIFTYLFHTMGEICLSPVGLSSVTKLAPRRFTGQMMGIWFLATSLGNLIAGLVAGEFNTESLDAVREMPAIYLQIVLTSLGAGVLLLVFAKPVQRLTGGIK